MASTADHDPRHHTQKMQRRLKETIGLAGRRPERSANVKAMFETAAEVLGGLVKAFHDYEQKNEAAWRS